MRRSRYAGIAITLVTVIAGTLAAGFATGSAEAADSTRITVTRPSTFDAPTAKRGGIMNPLATCSNWRVEPRMKWTLTRDETGTSRTFRWRGALPGLYFPRVRVGTYHSETRVTCRGNTVTRTHQLRIKQKTPATTVSRREFRRIHRGMTRAEVTDAVGTRGRDCSRYGRQMTCTYDLMRFWRWSIVAFRKGEVVDKYWNVAHD